MNLERYEIDIKKRNKALIDKLDDEELIELNTIVNSEFKRRFNKRYYRYKVSPTEVQWLVEPYAGKVKNKDFHQYLLTLSKSKRAADKNKQTSIYASKIRFTKDDIKSVEELESEYQNQTKTEHNLTKAGLGEESESIRYKLLPLLH